MVAETAEPPGLVHLFFSFFWVSLIGFGGVLPWARRMLVEQKRWLTSDQFNEDLALAQFLPGPNILNLTIVVGQRFRGAAGTLAATFGLMTSPVLVALGLALLYGRYGQLEEVHQVMRGVAAAAAGLILATAAKMAVPIIRADERVQIAFATITFVGVAVLGFSLPAVLFSVAPFSIAVALWRMR